MPDKPEFVSPSGVAYYATPATGEELEKLTEALQQAEQAYRADPEDVEKLIMFGRRLAYLWRYHEAIDVFCMGIKRHPHNPMLYRHRGHRYISIRDFRRAEADLAHAANLKDDSFEIWYHLGLARWLLGDFNAALQAYRASYRTAADDNFRAAASNWLWLTLRRTGHDDEAKDLLKGLQPATGEEAINYYLCLLYKGEKPEQEISAMMESSGIIHVTLGFGIGAWHLVSGRPGQARNYFEKVLEGSYWPGFGFIAAETELQRTNPATARPTGPE
ncbi:MAG: tetratricopeptide repeat protein [Bacillota bacterium]|nr:tetratricopeptide repeat protein [Bacillota bacterium]